MAPPLPPGALSPNFELDEFTTSRDAAVRGIDNTPTPQALANLRRLAELLEEVRTLLGNVPIHITSGYRSPALNKVVRGACDSAHLHGLAADFIAPRYGTPLEVCRAIRDNSLKFHDLRVWDQLIYEGTWVHLALAAEGKTPRLEVRTAVFAPGRRTLYPLGLPE